MSEPINDGGPAFPCEAGVSGYGNSKRVIHSDGTQDWIELNQGISMRDYFAAEVIRAIIAQGFKIGSEADLIAVGAYKMADAMLKARAAK